MPITSIWQMKKIEICKTGPCQSCFNVLLPFTQFCPSYCSTETNRGNQRKVGIINSLYHDICARILYCISFPSTPSSITLFTLAQWNERRWEIGRGVWIGQETEVCYRNTDWKAKEMEVHFRTMKKEISKTLKRRQESTVTTQSRKQGRDEHKKPNSRQISASLTPQTNIPPQSLDTPSKRLHG